MSGTSIIAKISMSLNHYLSSTFSRGCYNADSKNIIVNTCTACILEKKQNFNGIGNFLPFEKCAEH